MFEFDPIDKELESINSVLKAGLKGDIYYLPEDYFEKNSIRILNVKATSKLEVPEGYFGNLAENILSRIKTESEFSVSEELNTISPLLEKLSKENIYSLPLGYFENLPSSIKGKIAPARVVKMKPFYKYAIAAVITGLLGLGLFNNLNSHKEDNILKSDVYKTAYEILNKENFDEELETIPGDEATAYLKGYGQDVNSALAALSAEDYTLTSDEELFISNAELDHFLNINNINTTN